MTYNSIHSSDVGYHALNSVFRSVRDYAAEVVFKDLKHVKCLTFHSLAHKSIG